MSLTTTGSVAISPPTQGTYQGLVAFQDRAASNTNVITGNGNLNITGTIYTPAAPISVVANNSSTSKDGTPLDKVGSQIITNTFAASGSGSFAVNNTNATPVRLIQLLE